MVAGVVLLGISKACWFDSVGVSLVDLAGFVISTGFGSLLELFDSCY